MTLIEKNTSPLDKAADKIKKLVKFLFTSEGTITCLQYFCGMILLNLVAFVCGLVEETVFSVVVCIICLYGSLILIQKRSRDLGEKGTLSIVLILTAIFIREYYQDFHLQDTILSYPCIIIALCGSVAGLRLLFVKGKQNVDMQLRSPLTRYPLLTVVAYAVIFILLYVFADYIIPGRLEKSKIFNDAVTTVYRNVDGYANVCKKYGYDLKAYPKRFTDELQPEITFLRQEGDKLGISADEMYQILVNNEEFNKALETKIIQELENLRIVIIADFLAEKYNVKIEDLEWKDEYNDLLPSGGACKYLEELADSQDFFAVSSYSYVKQLIEGYKKL